MQRKSGKVEYISMLYFLLVRINAQMQLAQPDRVQLGLQL